jgi:hypothetical protein
VSGELVAAVRARFGGDGMRVVQLALDAVAAVHGGPALEMSAFLSCVADECPWMGELAGQLADTFLSLRGVAS